MPTIRDLIEGTRQAGADLSAAEEIYQKLLGQVGGDQREAYNQTELARIGRPPAGFEGLPQETWAAVGRIADSGEYPAVAPLLAGYEALKGIEQQTGIPTISALAKLKAARITAPKPGVTTQASLLNLMSGALGPILARR